MRRKKSRVSLLFLEEGEAYVKLIQTKIQHVALTNTWLQGYLHVNSRSLIFEPKAREVAVVKYAFRDFEDVPDFLDSALHFRVNQYTVLPSLHSPKPYQLLSSSRPQSVSLPVSPSDFKLLTDLFLTNHHHRAGFDVDLIPFSLSKDHKHPLFSVSWLQSPLEKPLTSSAIKCKRVIPLLGLDCMLYLSTERLYYQSQTPFSRLKSFPFTSIHRIFLRRYRLKNLAFELIFHSNKRLFLALETEATRDEIYHQLSQLVPETAASEGRLEKVTADWVNRVISNYEYLTVVNDYGGRSVCDFAQYPVFPWIVADYSSEKLDFSLSTTFRDLSKPLGALNPVRLEGFKKRYAEMSEPKFLYGSHYSNAGYVIGYLVRNNPLCALSLHVKHT